MMTLRDLAEVWWDIQLVSVDARTEDGKLLHTWEFGENIRETNHMWHDRKKGVLDIVDVKVNDHGKEKKNGRFEDGWGVNKKVFPDLILDAPISHMVPSPSNYFGDKVYIDVVMSREAVEMVKATLEVRSLDN